ALASAVDCAALPPAPLRRAPHIGAADETCAVHQPGRGRAVVVLPENVGLAVGIEIARADRVPGRTRIETGVRPKAYARAIHLPDRGRAVGVLPQDAAMAVAVEVAQCGVVDVGDRRDDRLIVA